MQVILDDRLNLSPTHAKTPFGKGYTRLSYFSFFIWSKSSWMSNLCPDSNPASQSINQSRVWYTKEPGSFCYILVLSGMSQSFVQDYLLRKGKISKDGVPGELAIRLH